MAVIVLSPGSNLTGVQLVNWLEHFPRQDWLVLGSGLAALVGFIVLGLVLSSGRLFRFRRGPLRDRLPPIQMEEPPSSLTNILLQEHEDWPGDKRKSKRRRGSIIRVFVSTLETREDVFEGFVIDRSVNGICLSVKREVAELSTLFIRAENAPADTPWVKVRVKNCRLRVHGSQLGCEFVGTPPWNVLLLFG